MNRVDLRRTIDLWILLFVLIVVGGAVFNLLFPSEHGGGCHQRYSSSGLASDRRVNSGRGEPALRMIGQWPCSRTAGRAGWMPVERVEGPRYLEAT